MGEKKSGKIKTAIIGMGKMGKLRAEVMGNHGGFEIAATCDPAGSWDYSDWKKCLDETKPEAVVVCTINKAMLDIVRHALGSGISVFCEKPPGRNLLETLAMKEALEKSGKVLKFGFNHRYHNSVMEAKALVESGLVGEIVCARGVYGKAGSQTFRDEWRNNADLSGGGILLDQGIHMLDLLCYFMGELEVQHSSIDRLAWSDLPVEDSAFALMQTERGQLATLHSSAIQWKHKFDLDLICSNGYIALNGLLTSTRSYGEERMTYYRKDYEQTKIGSPLEHTMYFSSDDSWDFEAKEFYDALRNGVPVQNGSIGDAVRVMELIDRIYRTSR